MKTIDTRELIEGDAAIASAVRTCVRQLKDGQPEPRTWIIGIDDETYVITVARSHHDPFSEGKPDQC